MKSNKYLNHIYKTAADTSHKLPELDMNKQPKLKGMKTKELKINPINSSTSTKTGLTPTGIKSSFSYKQSGSESKLHLHTPKILKKI